MDQLPDNLLITLGFVLRDCPVNEEPEWTHQRAQGRFYFHILDAAAVVDALIEIGHMEMRQKAIAAIESIDL